VIGYGSGPGSFTGLRIAASVAQGLAYSCQLPAVAVSTLAVLAQTALRSGAVGASHSVLCTLDARTNEVYSAVYEFADGLALRRQGPWACTPSELSIRATGALIALGSGCRYLKEFPPDIREAIGETVPHLLPCARDLIPLAQAQFALGETQSPAEIQPVYVRDEINWKKLAEQGKPR
jgi:tRNA threonylcarbamoyladenosine biosynthesis protein TsaB